MHLLSGQSDQTSGVIITLTLNERITTCSRRHFDFFFFFFFFFFLYFSENLRLDISCESLETLLVKYPSIKGTL